jgi:hypothetical protein
MQQVRCVVGMQQVRVFLFALESRDSRTAHQHAME